eukprot:scaffold12.g8067.t1
MLLLGAVAVSVAICLALFIFRAGKDIASWAARAAAEQALDAKQALVRVCTHGGAPALVAAAPTPSLAPSPLLGLYRGLCHAVAAEKRAGFRIDASQPAESFARLDAAFRRLVAGYIGAGHSDWRSYAKFNDVHYVESTCDFELMVICWAPGQASRVHNHASSHCWYTVLSGEVHEDRYLLPAGGGADEAQAASAGKPALPGVVSASSPCPPLARAVSSALRAGAAGYINDSMCLHAIRCPDACPAPGAVTLHIYAPPITRVRLFEPENNRVVERQPGFSTRRGTKV